jgi:hypothetical protein
MMSFFRGETVSILRKDVDNETFDEYGIPLETKTTIVIKDVIVDYNMTTAVGTIEEKALSTQVTLYFPKGTIIKDEDVFVIRNTKWEIDGHFENMALNPLGNTFLKAGVVVKVKQYKGNVENEQ